MDDRLREALASASAITELSIDLATLARRAPGSDTVHVDLAVQLSQPGASRELGIGYVVLNEANAVVASSTATQKPVRTTGSDAIELTTPLLLEPASIRCVSASSIRTGGEAPSCGI